VLLFLYGHGIELINEAVAYGVLWNIRFIEKCGGHGEKTSRKLSPPDDRIL